MTRKEIESVCEELALPIIEKYRFELVDVEYVKEGPNYYLRVYADKPGGITINDCVTVSRELSPLLDAYENAFPDAYTLEVSSPGLLRPLKKDKDFQRNLGKMIEIKLFHPVESIASTQFEAELCAYDADTIRVLDAEDVETVIERRNLAVVRLAFEF